MVEAIALDQNRIFPCAAWLTGEYGISDLYVGVPVKLGNGGIKEIIEIDLNKDEKALLDQSCNAVRGVFKDLERVMG
jgi:malate dehydrogenase